MTTPFAFVPRVVAKYTTPWEGISRSSPSRSSSPSSSAESDDEPSDFTTPSSFDVAKPESKEKAIESAHSKQSTVAQDIAPLISLALSDYNIWRDADLRWKLDACLTDKTPPGEAGYVPINYLLRRAPFRGSLPLASGQSEPSETEVVKALCTHASHALEVRMRLPSSASTPSSSVWYGTGKTSRKKDVGGYEVRRTDWVTLRDRTSLGWTRGRWDDVTVYMEGIPPQYRTVGGISRFTETLLSTFSASNTNVGPRLSVQCITLPPHYLDRPGDKPKCKGYALVMLSIKAHVEYILRAWPWKRLPAHEDGDTTAKEAHKYGFRTISKARWDALNEEYLLYKQRIVDEMSQTQSESHHIPGGQDTAGRVHRGEEPIDSPRLDACNRHQTQTTSSSPYPFGCLVFVRNVHPETNKTTLKSFFYQAFQDEGLQGKSQARGHEHSSGLDYVDFTKGMDSCYLRLTSPQHVTRLITYFDAQRKTQADGLDTVGGTTLGDDKPIAMERIQGKKEELYWDKVPEKVRQQAVDKAVNAQLTSTPNGGEATTSHHDSIDGRKHKRRSREP